MKHISDETANKILDGEIDLHKNSQISEYINNCAECRSMINVYITIEDALKNQSGIYASENILDATMKKIKLACKRNRQNINIALNKTYSVIFMLIVSAIGAFIIAAPLKIEVNLSSEERLISFIKNLSINFYGIVAGDLFRAGVAFLFIISAYLIYDINKSFIEKAKKIISR